MLGWYVVAGNLAALVAFALSECCLDMQLNRRKHEIITA